MCEEVKIYGYFDETYRIAHNLLIGDRQAVIDYFISHETLSDEILNEFKEASNSSKGVALWDSTTDIMLVWMPSFVPNADDISVLSHEFMHVYFYIAENWNLSIEVGKVNHEMIAYHEMLLRKFLQLLGLNDASSHQESAG